MKGTILSLIITSIVIPALAYRSQQDSSAPYYGPPNKYAPKKFVPKYRKPIKKCKVNKKCACKSHYKLAGEKLPYYDHELNAAQEDCFLATASNELELEKIRKIALKASLTVGGDFAYIGACRISTFDTVERGEEEEEEGNVEIARDGEKTGPWKWCDGCTEYKFNIFDGDQPDNPDVDPPESVAAVDLNGVMNGVNNFGEISDVQPDQLYAAVYECCEGPKSKTARKKKY